MARLHAAVGALALGLVLLDVAGAALVYQPVMVPAPHHHVELRSVRQQPQVQPQGGYLIHAMHPAQEDRDPESSQVRVARSPTKYKYGGYKGGYGGGGGYGGYPGGYGGYGGGYPVGGYGGYGGGCNTCGGGGYGGYPSGSFSQSSSQASSQSSSGSVGWGRRR